MKLTRNLLIAVLAAFSLTSGAFALTFTDTDGSPTWLSASDQSRSNDSVSGWLDITTGNSPNYNPLTMVLTSAKVSFAFADTNEPGKKNNAYDENDSGPGNDEQYKEYVSITLDGLAFLSNVEVDGTHAAFDWISASGNLAGNLFSALQADGKLKYVITITSGDVWFKGAKVVATGVYKTVPDASSTFVLLGLGLIGLAVVNRRK